MKYVFGKGGTKLDTWQGNQETISLLLEAFVVAKVNRALVELGDTFSNHSH